MKLILTILAVGVASVFLYHADGFLNYMAKESVNAEQNRDF